MRSALVAMLVFTRFAHADTEQALSLGVGYATFSVPGEAMGDMEPASVTPTFGGAIGIAYERALGTDVGLRGELLAGAFYGGNTEDQSAGSYAALADVGLGYRFDVLKYVPYAFAGLGAVVAGGGPITDGGPDLVLVVGGGLDVLTSRERSWGVELRLASFGGDITVVTAGLRGTTRWGFF